MKTSIPNEGDRPTNLNDTPGYHIRIKGNLSAELVEWLDNDVTVQNLESGEALLFCPTTDQAALHGILNRLYNLGLKILALQCCPEANEEASEKSG